MKEPSRERGCDGKINLGRRYVKQSNKMSAKHDKPYVVYRCPHCNGTHLSTKVENVKRYHEVLYLSGLTGSRIVI